MMLLHPVESRFPLTRGRIVDPADAHRTRELERFGLRFFVPDAVSPTGPAFDYCRRQQVTVDENGAPIVHGPSAGWSQTSTGNMDGNEETKMDRDPDSN